MVRGVRRGRGNRGRDSVDRQLAPTFFSTFWVLNALGRLSASVFQEGFFKEGRARLTFNFLLRFLRLLLPFVRVGVLVIRATKLFRLGRSRDCFFLLGGL